MLNVKMRGKRCVADVVYLGGVTCATRHVGNLVVSSRGESGRVTSLFKRVINSSGRTSGVNR